MIRQPGFISLIFLIFGCTTSENEQRQRIPDNMYRPSGFHVFINHGTENIPASLVKVDTLYHLFYTTRTDEWGHLVSANLLSWIPEISFPLSKHGYGEVIWDENNLTTLNAPWNFLLSNGDELNLSYSIDGIEWNDFEDNPILKAEGKPSAVWSADLERWVLTVANGSEVSFFTSENLTNWEGGSTLESDVEVSGATLLKVNGEWLILMQGEDLTYQMGSFDGVTFQPEGFPSIFSGIKMDMGTILNSSKDVIFISRNSAAGSRLPTFSTPLSLTLNNGNLNLYPFAGFQNEITGKRRARLSKLSTDGPSWFNFTINEEFEEMEIVISDNTSDSRVLWNKSDQKITISGSALPQNSGIDQSMEANFSHQNLIIDVLIDHATIDLFFNDGAFATSIPAIPDTFFSKVEVFLDGKKYDARGVLYDIGI